MSYGWSGRSVLAGLRNARQPCREQEIMKNSLHGAGAGDYET